jgi:outer membrane protein OmpA-like peptidoglycan-associated protein
LLSDARAKAVYTYIISKGIDSKRLSYKGYGETKPKITDVEIGKLTNESEKEKAHQSNRRTEYKIIKK